MSRFTYYISPNESSRIRAAIQSNFAEYFVQDLGIQKKIVEAVPVAKTEAASQLATTTEPTAATAADTEISSKVTSVASKPSSPKPASVAEANSNAESDFGNSETILAKKTSATATTMHHSPPKRADFVWIHTTTQHDRELRANPDTHVVSQLSGINIFEDKANLALLLQRFEETQDAAIPAAAMIDKQPTPSVQALASHVVDGPAEFRKWCVARFSGADASKGGFWIAKDSTANGAQGLHPFGCNNWKAVMKVIRPKTRLSIGIYMIVPSQIWLYSI